MSSPRGELLESKGELGAVNEMLAAIGESPISSFVGEAHADAANCRRILAKINRQTQAKGWLFNIEQDVQLLPDTFSRCITYLPDYLRVMSADGTVYVDRGGFLFDSTRRTHQFTQAVIVELIRLRDYDEMPECLQSYIVAKAARKLNMSFFGAREIDAFLREQEDGHWCDVMDYELALGKYNMLDGDVFVGGQLRRN